MKLHKRNVIMISWYAVLLPRVHTDIVTKLKKKVINTQIIKKKKTRYTWCGNDYLAARQNGQQKIIMNVN